MGHVISVTNQKGGVGKTLTATSLASLLTSMGYKILSIDMDPQCNFDQVAGGPGPVKQYDTKSKTILNVLKQECSMEEAIVHTDIGDLVRAHPSLSQWTGRSLLSRRDFKNLIDANTSPEELFEVLSNRYKTGWGAIEHKTLDWELKDVRENYDFVFLDTNPSLTLLTLNSLYTADYILIPAFTEESSRKAILELKTTLEDLFGDDKDDENTPKILGILIGKYKAHTKIAAFYTEVFKQLAKNMGTIVFDCKIRDGIAATEYMNEETDLIRYAPRSPVTQSYREFVSEFLRRIKAMEEVSQGG